MKFFLNKIQNTQTIRLQIHTDRFYYIKIKDFLLRDKSGKKYEQYLHKILLREIKENLKGKVYFVHKLEDSILLI